MKHCGENYDSHKRPIGKFIGQNYIRPNKNLITLYIKY